ncbi:MAG: HAD domain-containing protein [Burkholderiaceae bacterium]|jgi:hypothetical protein|nr:HAD domain-containing protein [Burkholderiaceae bacterium]
MGNVPKQPNRNEVKELRQGVDELMALFGHAQQALGSRNWALLYQYGRIMEGRYQGSYVSGIPADAARRLVDELPDGKTVGVRLMHRHRSGSYLASSLSFRDGKLVMHWTWNKTMRVLFLDFDGVLHPLEQAETSLAQFCWLPVLARALRPYPEVRIVVHSTWRYMYDHDELQLLLGPLGNRFLGATAPGPRFESIRGWLYANAFCSSYRVLDDDESEFPHPLPAEVILCESSNGVSARDVLAALTTWLETPNSDTKK